MTWHGYNGQPAMSFLLDVLKENKPELGQPTLRKRAVLFESAHPECVQTA
jgi:hypothetical protein